MSAQRETFWEPEFTSALATRSWSYQTNEIRVLSLWGWCTWLLEGCQMNLVVFQLLPHVCSSSRLAKGANVVWTHLSRISHLCTVDDFSRKGLQGSQSHPSVLQGGDHDKTSPVSVGIARSRCSKSKTNHTCRMWGSTPWNQYSKVRGTGRGAIRCSRTPTARKSANSFPKIPQWLFTWVKSVERPFRKIVAARKTARRLVPTKSSGCKIQWPVVECTMDNASEKIPTASARWHCMT